MRAELIDVEARAAARFSSRRTTRLTVSFDLLPLVPHPGECFRSTKHDDSNWHRLSLRSMVGSFANSSTIFLVSDEIRHVADDCEGKSLFYRVYGVFCLFGDQRLNGIWRDVPHRLMLQCSFIYLIRKAVQMRKESTRKYKKVGKTNDKCNNDGNINVRERILSIYNIMYLQNCVFMHFMSDLWLSR